MEFLTRRGLRITCCLIVLQTQVALCNDLIAKAESNSSSSVRVMSFNVRFGKADDGPNHWDLRKDLVIKTVREFDPDILGTQEMMEFQAEFFRQHLPKLAYHGTSRIPADKQQEQCAILYRKSRFEEVDAGHFWLSNSPDQPGSISWDSSLPRMVSWVKLRDKQDSRDEFFVFNTHFDNVGQEARMQYAAVLRRRILSLADGARVIVTGDFNSAEDSIAHRVLLFGTKQLSLSDTFQAVRTKRNPDGESTSSRWNGNRKGGRIDWILCSEHWKVLDAAIDRSHDGGRYPSDHYPVTAVVTFAAEESDAQ